jgi:hypothetical protein
MSNLQVMAPPPVLVESPLARNNGVVNSYNWSGYYNYSSCQCYSEAVAYYYEPTISSSRCANPSLAVWTGLGGWNNPNALAQDGTAYNLPGVNNHQSFIEELPNGPIAQPVYGTSGQTMALYVNYLNTGGVSYFIENSQGQSVNPTYYDGNNDQSTVDFIFEAPQVNGQEAQLANFGTDSFTYAGDGSTNLGGNPYNEVIMKTSGGTINAQPSSVSNGNSFSVTQKSCFTQ